MIDLNNTVLLTATDGLPPPPRDVICHALLSRYGGSGQNWLLSEVQGGFLVKSPDWLSHDAIEGDENFWVSNFNLLPLPWQTQNRVHLLPACELVTITIHRFPLDFWHPFYFRQAVAAMGVLTGISEQGLRGEVKSTLRLRILCADRSLIPYFLYISHKGEWSKCQTDMDGRPPPLSNDPSLNPSPDPEYQSLDRSIHGGTYSPPPYIPPWRCRHMSGPTPVIEPLRRGVMVAQMETKMARFANLMRAPGSPILSDSLAATFQNGGQMSQDPALWQWPHTYQSKIIGHHPGTCQSHSCSLVTHSPKELSTLSNANHSKLTCPQPNAHHTSNRHASI